MQFEVTALLVAWASSDSLVTNLSPGNLYTRFVQQSLALLFKLLKRCTLTLFITLMYSNYTVQYCYA